MTREEAIAELKRDIELDNDFTEDYINAVNIAIQALEQEPCDDCISRKALTDTTICEGISCNECSFNTCEDGQSGCLLKERVDKLPPVIPQPKTGRWILSGGYWRCSECNEKALLKLDKANGGCREYMPVRSKHCPSCGIKMQEVKE